MRLIELASHDGPLESMLTAMCDQVAAIADVEIASIYVCEDEALVMRGNHGFGLIKQGFPSDRWITLFHDWLTDQGLA